MEEERRGAEKGAERDQRLVSRDKTGGREKERERQRKRERQEVGKAHFKRECSKNAQEVLLVAAT